MRRVAWAMVAILALGACETSQILTPVGDPAAPRNLDAFYYAGAVTVTWELGAGWNGEAFRVYAKRVSDPDYFFIAEVTSCGAGICTYEDLNVVSGVTYEYYVASVDDATGAETPSEFSVQVTVPSFTPPPVLAVNGETYRYFVSAVDEFGHESGGGALAAGTPRPDYHGEWVYAFSDQPGLSGFRFEDDEGFDPIVAGTDPSRAFRLEADEFGWWLVPGPDAAIYPQGFATTALKCGVAADAGCVDVPEAPASGYATFDVEALPQTSYVFRVVGADGRPHYGVIRVELIGFDQSGNGIMIFDWAYQSQADNPNLSPVTDVPTG